MNESLPDTVAAEPPAKIDAAILKVAGVVVIGAFMSILDITVVNVALPTFQEEFDVQTYSTVAWTVTAFTLALATVIPLTGWAADRFGTKRLFLAALILFTGGSVLCALAWSIQALIMFRVVQGLGGGILMPLGMTIMTREAGPDRMGRLMAILGVPVLLGPILGPILGGWLLENASWHWVFLINFPIGVVSIAYAWIVLPRDEPKPTESFDFIGMLMLSPGLALFLYGVSVIPGEGTLAAPKVWSTMSMGAVLLLAFVIYSFKPAHPLLDLRLFGNYDMTVSIITLVLFAAAFFGGLLLVPTYFQQVRGESPLMAGLLVAPQGLGALLTMPLSGALTDRIPVGRIVPVGLVIVTVSMFGLTRIDQDTAYWYLVGVLFVMGLGMGGTMMPLMTASLRTLSEEKVARGSTLLNIAQQIASSVGVAVISVVLTNHTKTSKAVEAAQELAQAQRAGTQPAPALVSYVMSLGNKFESIMLGDMARAYANTYWVAVALCVITLGASLFLPRKYRIGSAPSTGRQPTSMLMS
ncbi:DHA2 family efflux MFS transporter permease subunit [Nocardia sp. NPDC004260]